MAMHGTRVVVEPVELPPSTGRPTDRGGDAVSVAVVVIAALSVVGIAFLIGAVKIVRPYQRGLVERLGPLQGHARNPGST